MADQKFGRNKRAPTNAGQARRTERNKRLHAESAHAAKIQQPHAGQKSEDMYGHHVPLNTAQKFLNACMRVWGLRNARASARKEES